MKFFNQKRLEMKIKNENWKWKSFLFFASFSFCNYIISLLNENCQIKLFFLEKFVFLINLDATILWSDLKLKIDQLLRSYFFLIKWGRGYIFYAKSWIR
jgi:hypothetical protein